MLRTVADQPTLWEAILPEELRRLPVELVRVDALLDDSLFFAPVRAVLRPQDGTAVDADGNLPAVDVFEVPVPAWVRVVVPGGIGFDHLAAVLPDRAGPAGAASNDVDEVDHPVRLGGGGGVERGAAGQGRGGQAAALHSDPGRHHRGAVERGIPTDSGLLAKAVRRIVATGRRIRAAGGAV